MISSTSISKPGRYQLLLYDIILAHIHVILQIDIILIILLSFIERIISIKILVVGV